jgi:hypothetical protein
MQVGFEAMIRVMGLGEDPVSQIGLILLRHLGINNSKRVNRYEGKAKSECLTRDSKRIDGLELLMDLGRSQC